MCGLSRRSVLNSIPLLFLYSVIFHPYKLFNSGHSSIWSAVGRNWVGNSVNYKDLRLSNFIHTFIVRKSSSSSFFYKKVFFFFFLKERKKQLANYHFFFFFIYKLVRAMAPPSLLWRLYLLCPQYTAQLSQASRIHSQSLFLPLSLLVPLGYCCMHILGVQKKKNSFYFYFYFLFLDMSQKLTQNKS
jgi:hypothetical protein